MSTKHRQDHWVSSSLSASYQATGCFRVLTSHSAVVANEWLLRDLAIRPGFTVPEHHPTRSDQAGGLRVDLVLDRLHASLELIC